MPTRVLAEFPDRESLLDAARQLRAEGRRALDTLSPYPLRDGSAALGLRRSPVPLVVLCCALLGASGGYLMQVWMNAVDFPINVGGRPLHSAPAFIPIAFELAVLFGALGAVGSLLVLLRLPRLWAPELDLKELASATVHGLWLVAAAEEGEDAESLRERMRAWGASRVVQVPLARGEGGSP